MKVVQMTEWQSRETREALQRLLEMAQRGEIVGMALCYMTNTGQEAVLRTGPFRRRGIASRAGFLMQLEDFALPETAFG